MKPIFPGTVMRNERERGGILVVAVIVILAMLIMAIPFLFKLSGQWRSTERSNHSLAAFNLAEAGVERALYYLDPDTPVVSDPESIVWTNDGANLAGVMNDVRSSDAKVIGDVNLVLGPPYGTEPPRRNLDSTGIVPFIADKPVDRTVRVTLEQVYNSIFDVGFFVDQFFYIHNAFDMDAYDSRDGAYGASLPGGGTNSGLPDAIFGSNSYIGSANPNDPGESTWVIDAGGNSSDINGSIIVGGRDAEAGTLPSDANAYDDEVISAPDGVLDESGNGLMKQEYDLPPVDVFNLPPKDVLGTMPVIGEWFEGYTEAAPSTATYYEDRLVRPPTWGETKDVYEQGPLTIAAGGTGSLTPADNGVYTSLSIGDEKTGATLNVSGGGVAIYVT